MSSIIKVLDTIDNFFQKFITGIFIVMTALYFIQIVARYVFSTGISWSEEMVRYLMVWLTYIGATILAKDNSHIAMTVLEDVFPFMKKGLWLLKYIVMIVYCAIVAKFSFAALEMAKVQTSSAMLIPMNIIYVVIPLSMVLMIIHLGVRTYNLFKGVE